MRAEVASPTYLGRPLGPHRRGARGSRPGWPRACVTRLLRAGRARCTSTRRRRGCDATTAGWRSSRRAGPSRARRVLLATSAYPPLLRAMRRYVAARLRLRAGDRAAGRRTARRDRLAPAPGHRRRRQPASTTTGSPPTTGSCGAASTPSTATAVRSARSSTTTTPTFARLSTELLHHLPAARGAPLHAPLGRGDRHLQPLLGVLRHRPPRARGLRHGLHRASGSPRRGSARAWRSTCSTAATTRGHPAALRPPPAGALPARAAAHGRHPAHAEPPRRGRRARRAPWAVARRAGPAGARLRQLIGPQRPA